MSSHMSYPRVDSGPALSARQTLSPPPQDEIDAASRQRAFDALYRALDRLVRGAAEDWRHCGKAACLRSRRCRGFACEPKVRGDES